MAFRSTVASAPPTSASLHRIPRSRPLPWNQPSRCAAACAAGEVNRVDLRSGDPGAQRARLWPRSSPRAKTALAVSFTRSLQARSRLQPGRCESPPGGEEPLSRQRRGDCGRAKCDRCRRAGGPSPQSALGSVMRAFDVIERAVSGERTGTATGEGDRLESVGFLPHFLPQLPAG